MSSYPIDTTLSMAEYEFFAAELAKKAVMEAAAAFAALLDSGLQPEPAMKYLLLGRTVTRG